MCLSACLPACLAGWLAGRPSVRLSACVSVYALHVVWEVSLKDLAPFTMGSALHSKSEAGAMRRTVQAPAI